MDKNILKLRGAIAAAQDVTKECVREGDTFDDATIDHLIEKLDNLKAKIKAKLAEQKTVSKDAA